MAEKPNQNKFLADFNDAVDNFADRSFDKIISISHNDADGISSLHLIQNLLYQRYDYDYFIYNRSVSWSNYLNGILSKNNSEKNALIFTDVGSNLTELIPIVSQRKEHFFILDHHEVDMDISNVEFPENLHFVNPTIHGYDGLDHIAGATLAYMFAKKLKPSIIRQGWLAVIGIAGDTLRSMDKLESYNKKIYEELKDEEIIEDNNGLVLFGSMHESIKSCLRYSILPFVSGLGGEDDGTIKLFLKKLRIDPAKKAIALDSTEIQKIQEKLDVNCVGNYAILPKKQRILKFAFEHALLLNILCFKNINAAVSITQRSAITLYAQNLYYDYIANLAHNLRILASAKLPRFETEKAIFIDVGGNIPPSNWSDTASFSTVNDVINPDKVLFLGGEEKKNHMIKLSIRCSRQYLKQHQNIGVNTIISKIKEELGGMGGGHKLAGGIRLSQASFNRLKQNIDEYII
jgi:single-stranded DNA-specific DHH superfamily exonuclease